MGKGSPVQEFDESADEHQDFFEKNELSRIWDAEIDEARIDILAERRAKGAREDYDKEINAKLSEAGERKNYGNLTTDSRRTMQAAKWIWKIWHDFAERNDG